MNDNQSKKKDAEELELSNQAEKLGVPYLYKIPNKIDKDILSVIPENLAFKHQMVVFDKENDLIRVAMIDVNNIEALNVLPFITEKEGFRLEIYLTSV